jgi:regulator of protease activity HflC (stomatin/prohibitin superfamily)
MNLAYTGAEFIGQLPPGSPDDVDNLLIYEIVPQPNHKAIHGWEERVIDLLLPARGLIWVGWPEFYDLYKYRFQWMDEKFVDREPETLDSIMVTPYIYGMIYKDLELGGGIPYDIRFKVPLQVINPALALFRVERYVDATMDIIRGQARNEFSLKLEYGDFVTQTSLDNSTVAAPSTKLKEATDRILAAANTELKKFGVMIVGEIKVDIDPASDMLRQITIEAELAKQAGRAAIEKADLEAKAGVKKAQGEADALNIKATAEANALTTVGEAAEKLGEKAIHLKELETIKGSALTLFGGIGLPTTTTFTIPTTK